MKRAMNSSRLEERDQGVAIRPVFGLDVVDVSVVNAMLGYVGDTDGTWPLLTASAIRDIIPNSAAGRP